MDDASDFDSSMPVQAEDGQKRIEEECKKIADLFEASSTSMFEGQDGPIFHLEFDGAEKFEKFAEYLESQGLLPADAVPSKSDEAH
jgi:hypothetical protein